jgi:hypothetical protein
MLLEDYALFSRQARIMTQIHATPHHRPRTLADRQDNACCEPCIQPAGQSGQHHMLAGSPTVKKVKGDSKMSNASSNKARKRALKRL